MNVHVDECRRREPRHPEWETPHGFTPNCCQCCFALGKTTMESMMRYGLLNLRAEFLTDTEKDYIPTAPLDDLVALAQVANARMAFVRMHHTRFSI